MGDRYELDLKCAYCSKLNKDVYYAPTCNFYTFECQKCQETNFITFGLESKKREEVTLQNIEDGFWGCSNFPHDEGVVREECEEILRRLKK